MSVRKSFWTEDSSVLSVKIASKKSQVSDFEPALYVIHVLKSDTVYYSFSFKRNRIILYSECLNPKYSLFILYFEPLFIIHYSASTPRFFVFKIQQRTFQLHYLKAKLLKLGFRIKQLRN